tara:strand:- start:108 stop:452 length:345 start_codon:yes stop_codon:yes gene_type:complete
MLRYKSMVMSNEREVYIMSAESKSKKDLVADVSSSTGLSKADVQKVIDQAFSVIVEWVKSGHIVNMVNFIKLSKKRREARVGRNPRDGSELHIPASWVVSFSAGKAFKDAVKES